MGCYDRLEGTSILSRKLDNFLSLDLEAATFKIRSYRFLRGYSPNKQDDCKN